MPANDQDRFQDCFQFLAENCSDVVCRADVDMVLRYVSPASFLVLGWQPEEMLGKRLQDFVLEEDYPLLPTIGRLASAPTDPGGPLRWRKKGGMLAWIDIKCRPARISTTEEPKELVIVLRDITERRILEEKIAALLPVDPATGLSTHRTFDELLEREWNRTLREGTCLSLLLLDFHNFKQFHGRRGHLEGDGCLSRAAAAVMRVLRSTDLAARFGMEEIAIVLPATETTSAMKVAAKLQAAIEPLRSRHRMQVAGHSRAIVSIGAATFVARSNVSIKGPALLILAAESALHRSERTALESQRRASDAYMQPQLSGL